MAKRKMIQDEAIIRRIGAKVYFLRSQRGVTIKALAKEAGMHANTLTRIESGMGCSVGNIYRLARALNAKVDDFLQNTPLIVAFPPEIEKPR